MPTEAKPFMLEGEPYSKDIEISEDNKIEITDQLREKAQQLIKESYTQDDRIDSAHIGQDSNGRINFFVNVNKGNVGSGTIQEVFNLE